MTKKDRFISNTVSNINIDPSKVRQASSKSGQVQPGSRLVPSVTGQVLINKIFLFLILLIFSVVFVIQGQITTKKYYVESIHFVGNNSLSTSKLRRVIKLKEPRFLQYVEFNRRSLKLDALTIKNYYSFEGYLQARVEEFFEIAEDGGIVIYFRINEGTRSYLRSVQIEGNESIPERRIKKILELKINKPFNPIVMRQGYRELDKEYRKIGRLHTSIEEEYFVTEQIDLRLMVKEGPIMEIDTILIDGLVRVEPSMIYRELVFFPQTVYNENLIELSQRRLFETGLFSIVNIFPIDSRKGGESVDIHIDVKEFEPRGWLSEGGFYPIQPLSEGAEPTAGIGATIEWRHRSLFSSRTRFSVKGSFEIPITTFKEMITNQVLRFETTFSRLWIGRLRVPNSLRIFFERFPRFILAEETFNRYGVEWDYLHKYSDESILKGGIKWIKIQSSDTSRVENEQERSFRISYRYRNVDNPIYPKTGMIVSFEPSLVGAFLGGSRDYYRAEIELRKYTSIWSSWVFAFRSKIGWMAKLTQTSSQIPDYDLFYLGGSTSLRGWESQMFISDESDPKGGTLKVLMNLEFRIPIWWRLGMDLFVEGGILANNENEFWDQLNEWKNGTGWNYGVEITVSTPFGPIRFCYAKQMNKPKMKGMPFLGLLYAF